MTFYYDMETELAGNLGLSKCKNTYDIAMAIFSPSWWLHIWLFPCVVAGTMIAFQWLWCSVIDHHQLVNCWYMAWTYGWVDGWIFLPLKQNAINVEHDFSLIFPPRKKTCFFGNYCFQRLISYLLQVSRKSDQKMPMFTYQER